VARALDFGVAKATARIQTTREGHLKGKLAYMSPEQLSRKGVDRRADVFAASIVLWETLTCERLFGGDDVGDLVARILTEPIEPPSKLRPEVKVGLDAIVLRGLLRDPNDRYGSAREMAAALEAELAPARAAQVGEWVDSIAGDVLRRRAQRVAEIERSSSRLGTARDEERGVQVPRAGDPAYATAPTLMVIDSSSQAGLGSGAEGVASRVTELSSASPPPATRVRTRTQRVGVAALLMVALAVASFGALVRRRHTRAPAAAVAASKSPPREEIGAMSVESPFSAAASASSSAGAAKPSSSTAPAVPTVRGHPRQDCSPPYYFDAAGLKHFKPGCV
jgi:serine/threonine-protein kinase